jgi:pto-interacting protein 1
MENKNESKEEVQRRRLQEFLQTNGRALLQKMGNIHIRLRHFTRYEIRNITKGYNKTGLLGEGAFGKVYKGVLDDHSPVAVKVYKDGTSKEDFAKEVIVHYQMKHENVVRLMGCCTEKNALMIVMEFVSNGDLNRILHCREGFALPLDKRLDIAIKVAEALWFMHSMHSPLVIHGDIKPANILLDEDLAPNISDFGIAKLLSDSGPKYTKNYIGPIVGYVDPAYCSTRVCEYKIDI